MATIEINGRTWTSALGPNFSDEQVAEMLAWQKSSEHVSPVAATDDLYRRCPTCKGNGEDPAAKCFGVACSTCDGHGFVPVADPAPPVLLTAARAVIDNAVIVEGNPPLFAHGDRCEVPVARINALRRAVESAPDPTEPPQAPAQTP